MKSEKSLENNYVAYVNAYRNAARALAKKGGKMYSRILDYDQYLEARQEQIDNMTAQGKKVQNVNRSLVQEQKYPFSNKQLEKIKEAYEEHPDDFDFTDKKKLTKFDIVKHSEEFWEVVKDYAKKYKNKLVTQTVAQYFFGSK